MIDVLVTGGGFAARSCALHLKRLAPDARVLRLEPTRAPLGEPPLPGVAFAAPGPDHVAAHEDRGDERFLAEVRLAALALDAMQQEAAAAEAGFRRVVVARDLVPSLDERRREHDALAMRFEVAPDAVFDSERMLAGLDAAGRAAGVDVVNAGEAGAETGDDAGDEFTLDTTGERAVASIGTRRVEAERVVLAHGAALTRFDRWVGGVTVPARVQALRATVDGAAPDARSVGPGFAVCSVDGVGRLAVAEGIEPQNLGDPFDPGPHDATQRRLEQWLTDVVVPGRPVTVEARGATARLFSCDGLPLVGPHPLRATCLLAAAFGGRDAALGYLAGRVVAEIIVSGRAQTLGASLWSPRRML